MTGSYLRTWNHDWLKNVFIQELRKCARIVSGEVIDDGFLARFTSASMANAATCWNDVADAVRHFEQEMSPRVWVETGPVRYLPHADQVWLGLLAHRRWLHAHKLDEELIAIADLVARCASLCGQLRSLCELEENVSPTLKCSGVRECLNQLTVASSQLSARLSNLPREGAIL